MNKIVIISTVLLCCSIVSIAQSKGKMLKQTDESVSLRESNSNSKLNNEQQVKKKDNAFEKNEVIVDANRYLFKSSKSSKGTNRVNVNLKAQKPRPHELRHSKKI